MANKIILPYLSLAENRGGGVKMAAGEDVEFAFPHN